MTGVGFDYQPDEETGGEVESADGAGSYVNLKDGAGFYADGDHGAAGFEGFDDAGKNVAGAEEVRCLGGYEDVAGADGASHFAAGLAVAQGDFDFAGGVIERDAHHAVGGAVLDDDCGENIFEAGGVGEFDAAGSIEDGAGGTGFLNAAVCKCDDALADGVNFFTIVGHIKNRNAVGVVPGAQVLENGAAQGRIEAVERLVKEQDARASDQGAGEGDALLFAAGKFRRAASQQISYTKSSCDAV